MRLFEYLGGLSAPLRLADLFGPPLLVGPSPTVFPPVAVAPEFSFLGAPILYQSHRIGIIYLGQKKAGEEFTEADEETLVLFASQAAMVLSNARRYREEQRARNDLKTLIKYRTGGRDRLGRGNRPSGFVQSGSEKDPQRSPQSGPIARGTPPGPDVSAR